MCDEVSIRQEARKERVCASDVHIAGGSSDRIRGRKAGRRRAGLMSARRRDEERIRADGEMRILHMTIASIDPLVIGIDEPGSGSTGRHTRSIGSIMRSICGSVEA